MNGRSACGQRQFIRHPENLVLTALLTVATATVAPGRAQTKGAKPVNIEYYHDRTRTEVRNGHFSSNPNSPYQRMLLAQHLIMNEHILEGRKILLPLCHRPDTTARMYALLARTYLEDPEQDPKQNGEIERDLKMAMSLDPEDGNVYHLMASYCIVQGRLPEAMSNAEKALKAKQRDTLGLKDLFVIYGLQGKNELALKNLDQFMTENTPNSDMYEYRASILEKMKRYDEAATACRQSLKLRNQDATYFKLAHCLELAGKYGVAIDELSRLVKSNPEDSEALAARARLHLKNKNSAAALADFTRALTLEPSAKLYNERAALYTAMGNKAAADKDLARAKQQNDRPF